MAFDFKLFFLSRLPFACFNMLLTNFFIHADTMVCCTSLNKWPTEKTIQ